MKSPRFFRFSLASSFHRLALGLLTILLATTTHAEEPAATAPTPSAAPTSLLDHLTLDEAIARALRNNKRIKVSDFGRGISRANVLAEYGRFEPAITFRRSYSESELPGITSLTRDLTKTDNYSLGLEGVLPLGTSYRVGGTAVNERGTANFFTDNYLTFGGVSVTQPLLRGFGFGTNLAGLRIAKANRAISDWEHRQTVIDTVTNVIFMYHSLAEARATLRIAQRSHGLAAQLVSDNEKRNSVGSLSDADVIQARARVANREEFILVAARAVRDIENRLRALMGETSFSISGAELEIDPLVPAIAPSVDGATDLQHAFDLRPDYQAAKLGITRSRASAAAAWNQMLPRLDFVGSYGYNGLDRDFARSRAQVRNEDNRAYSAGVVVSIPLTLAEGRGRARAAKLSLRQAETDLDRLQQDISVTITAALGQLETTAKRVEATTRAYQLAQQALDAEQKRFKAGTSSTFFVLQLQEQLASVESNQVEAIADQLRAIANYQREIGTTLQAHGLSVE